MDAVGDDLGETMGNIIAASLQADGRISRTPCWFWATPTAAFPPSAPSVCTSRSSTWRPATAARTSACLRRPTAASWTSSPMSTCATRARPPLPCRLRPAQGAHLCHRLPHGGSAARQNLAKIEASDIHSRARPGKESTYCSRPPRGEHRHREELPLLFNAINAMAEKYDMPILYSCHPRSRKRLERRASSLTGALFARAAGLSRLQLPADERLRGSRDSGTLPEESSFFTCVGHPFPAVCIRTSTERPEALDKGCFILAGIDEEPAPGRGHRRGDERRDGSLRHPRSRLRDENVSTKVVKIIQSYTGVVNKMVWRKEKVKI